MNPYTGTTFFEFLILFIERLYTGAIFNLVSDEVQVLVLIGVSISSALVGSFLILRRMTMLANALSHTILFGIVIAYLIISQINPESSHHLDIPSMLFASVLMGVATAFLTEFLTKTVRLQEDASTGLVFTTLFAIGIIMVTLLTRNAHIGTEVVMGNVDALHVDDLKLVYSILGVNLLLFGLFYKEYKITSFDSSLARSLGISALFFNYLLMVQVSATCIGAFRAVGVLMVLAFITGPPLIARMYTHRLKSMLLNASLIGIFASIVGVAFSRHLLTFNGLALSTGGIVVCIIALFFLLSIALQMAIQGVYSKPKYPPKTNNDNHI